MPSQYSRDRLQPSLLDRLEDGLLASLAELVVDRRALEPRLDEAQRVALQRTLDDERFDGRIPDPEARAALAGLDRDAAALLARVLEHEAARRREMRRSVVISAAELRRAVLRDLQTLLNTTAAEAGPEETAAELEGFPAVQASVLNYGVPSLAGRIRTPDDFAELAGRIERAIERYEPRLRQVRVRPAEPGEGDALTTPLALIIEGELWGHPVSEHLTVRTLLDLDAGRVEVTATERSG